MPRTRSILLTLLLLCGALPLFAQKSYTLKSPDGQLSVTVRTGDRLTYTVTRNDSTILEPSQIALELLDGRTLGVASRLRDARSRSVDETIDAPFYKRAQVEDRYNLLTLRFRDRFSVEFRAYDEAVAYRFVTDFDEPYVVKNEIARFEFGADCPIHIPYARTRGPITRQYNCTFENVYTTTTLRETNPEKLAFLPVVIEKGGCQVCIAEADVEHYPGMFVWNPQHETALTGHFAPLPDKVEQGGYNFLQGVVLSRHSYIAPCDGARTLPWRIVIVAAEARQLADNDMVYRLASPSRVEDISWIRPGKVAWEWWNACGLKEVDFEAGINNATYKAYIDFAAKYGIEYILLDDGWSERGKADLMLVVPQIDLRELVDYGRERGVGILLWAGYKAFDRDMERVCAHYAAMGIKGFKIDYMDHDDQTIVDFHYRAAAAAARHRLVLDFHGTYKPTGLNRTYPNVLNFEGVYGLEQCKINMGDEDQVTYDVMIPFLRMVAGPADYTPGAMRNASKENFRQVHSEPMSQGTRCRQLAAYILFEAPLAMLCDSPWAYEREAECTRFIAGVPTTWDETVALDGRIGDYAALARRKGDVWYVAAMTDWDARELELDLSMLGEGNFEAELFRDGRNAHRFASDYLRERIVIPADRRLRVPLAPGGGCALRIVRK